MAANEDRSWFFSIPGNIKQRFLPFQLNPTASINQFSDNSDSWAPQVFSYKSRAKQDAYKSGYGKIGFYPAAFSQANPDILDAIAEKLNKDISFRLLYSEDERAKTSLTLDSIINTLPGVSIREFLPDTRLDQCLNFFRELFGKVAKLPLMAKDITGSEESKIATLMSKLWECTKFTLKYMTGNGNKSFLDDSFGEMEKASIEKIFTNADDKIIKYVHDFPFILYYRLQSCTTTNIYEVPAMCEGKPIMSSDGMAGWGSSSDIMSAGGFNVSKLFNKIPVIGDLAGTLLNNIGINYMPWWDAASGTNTTSPEINIKFDLFNDSLDKALKNFIFVNTIVPGNRWIQYNMFQHSSNIYDVKIDGVNRLFACSGKFDVTYEGVLRNPPQSFYDTLVKVHLSTSIDKEQFKQSVVQNNLIKIPDVYRVNMSFKSLLPANFNNYLYTYTQNTSHIVKYGKAGKTRQPGLGEYFAKGINMFTERVKNVWEAGDQNFGLTDDEMQKFRNAQQNMVQSAIDKVKSLF